MEKPVLLTALKDTNVLKQELDQIHQAYERSCKQVPLLQKEIDAIVKRQNEIRQLYIGKPTYYQVIIELDKLEKERVKRQKRIEWLTKSNLIQDLQSNAKQVHDMLLGNAPLDNNDNNSNNNIIIDLNYESSRLQELQEQQTTCKRKWDTLREFDLDEVQLSTPSTNTVNPGTIKKWKRVRQDETTTNTTTTTSETETNTNTSATISTTTSTTNQNNNNNNWKQQCLLKVKKFNLLSDVISTPCYCLRQFCETCHAPLISLPNESQLICTQCSRSHFNIENSTTSLSYTGDMDYTPYEYERSTHLMDIIEPFRPRIRVVIPQHVYDAMKGVIRLQRYPMYQDLTFLKGQYFLKELGLNAFYKVKFQLMMDINNRYWTLLTEQQELVAIQTFLLYQPEFDNSKGVRHSFTKYDFTTWHTFNMHKFYHLLPFLRRLEILGRHKQQIYILRNICRLLKINYRPCID